ncbi:MAG: translocation/assembly module TamB domain-containing protein, partial [Flavobacteriales bacterium]|nr:translocation/assembly module TamB domain-containing protein [Flavobacteriales bacterium]
EGIELPIHISGRVRGPVSEMKGRDLVIRFGERSHFRGHAELTGLPDFANTFMLVDVDELRTMYTDLAALPMPPFKDQGRLMLPPEIRALGDLRFAGNFTGFVHAFTAYGTSHTALGTLRTDLSYQRPQGAPVFHLSGRLATADFRPGPLIHLPALGAMAANIRIEGHGRSLAAMQATVEGDFPLITVNDTRITGVTASGHLEPNRFNGALHANDQHLVLDFNGLADLTGQWPQVDFTAMVQHADLRAFGLVTDQAYSTISMAIAAEGRLAPDSLQGRLEFADISYCDDRGEHDLGDLLLTSDRRAGRNVIQLTADMADAEVVGDFLPTRLPRAVAHVIYSAFPALRDEVAYAQERQDFRFTVRTKDTRTVLDLFVPGLHVDSGGTIDGWLNSGSFGIGLSARLPGITYRGLRATHVDLVADKTMDVLVFGLDGERVMWGDSIWVSGASITGKAYQDELDMAMGWSDSNSGTNGQLAMLGEVRGMGALSLDLLPSRIHLGRGNWETTQHTRIEIDSSTVFLEPLHLFNAGQRIGINGTVSKDTTAHLDFTLHKVQIANLAPFIDGPQLHGTVNAHGRVHALYGAPFVLSHVELDSVHVEHRPLGDITFDARWTDGQRAITMEGDVQRGAIKALDFAGEMSLAPGNELDLRLVMDRFDLRFIDPYLPEGISDIQGRVTGQVTMTGPLAMPEVRGGLDLQDAGLRIDYLNTLYRFSRSVSIEPDMFALDHVTVHDEEGGTARVGATILHHGFKDWDYNVWGRMDHLLVLNTTAHHNSLYYGKAYGTGDLELSGRAGSMEVSVDARTGPGTDIHLPVGGSTEVSAIGFVRFTAGDSLVDQEPSVDLSGISLDLNVEVTPDARFELIFDPTVGDILSGRGRGNLEMTVAQTGAFAMRGQVEVTDGDYLFTLRNVVNKRFQIEPGGRIVWYGDPFDAQLDLSAVYRVRAPLYDIMFDKNEAYRRRVPVDVTMHLRDRLLNPAIDFEVRLPTVDESVRTQVNSVLSTEQELNQQVFALIVLNRFMQPSSLGGGGNLSGGAAAGTTGSELLSNQVSNWLSKLSSDLDLGVNYRPGNNLTQDELELAVGTQLLNERLLLNTNLGVQYGASASQANNTLIGDFQLEYLLPPEGKLRLKAYSISNDRNLNRTD